MEDMVQSDDSVRIPLLARDNVTVRGYAVVDVADAEWLTQWTWRLGRDSHNDYAYRCERLGGRAGRLVHHKMHRVVLGLSPGKDPEVDHTDGDGLNNRRSNLRKATHAQNMQNYPSIKGSTSSYRGVSWKTKHRKWVAQARIGGKQAHLGYFEHEEDAAAAVRAALATHQPFAV